MSRFSRVTPAECYKCSRIVAHSTLRRQMLWNGPTLVDTGLLVCPRCYDQSSPQYRRTDYSDPKPIKDPRYPRETFINVPVWELPNPYRRRLVWNGEQVTFDGTDMIWTA